MSHFFQRCRLLSLLAAAALLGCATQGMQTLPVELRKAAPDSSIIYFLRPDNDAVDARDNPTLHVNGRPVAVLGFASYTAVTLAPGTHRVSLVAGTNDSKNWNIASEVETKAGVTYFVAIWHQRQPRRTPDAMVPYGALGVLVFHLLDEATNPQMGDRVARFEQITQEVAEYAAAGLRAVPAATTARAR